VTVAVHAAPMPVRILTAHLFAATRSSSPTRSAISARPVRSPTKRPYDRWSCDSRCRRLYDLTPCASNSDCGGNICMNTFCGTPCMSTQEPWSCFTSSG
jgi:hypothetical protein